jgi:hypothetical protein
MPLGVEKDGEVCVVKIEPVSNLQTIGGESKHQARNCDLCIIARLKNKRNALDLEKTSLDTLKTGLQTTKKGNNECFLYPENSVTFTLDFFCKALEMTLARS